MYFRIFRIDEVILYYSCVDEVDDIYTPCFGCDADSAFRKQDIFQTNFDHYGNFYPYGYHDYPFSIDRQTGETFTATRQSRRTICSGNGGGGGGRRCRLRVDRKMEVRDRTYGQAFQFVQNEQYISDEDLDLLRRFYHI